jgi:hypothetical protein
MEIIPDTGMTVIPAGFAEECRVELHATNASVAQARLIYEAPSALDQGMNQMPDNQTGW